jgi:hypothetical protein
VTAYCARMAANVLVHLLLLSGKFMVGTTFHAKSLRPRSSNQASRASQGVLSFWRGCMLIITACSQAASGKQLLVYAAHATRQAR